MKTALILCFASLPALAIDLQGERVTLNDEDRATLKTCSAANPCNVWSLEQFKALLIIYRAKLIDSGTGCRRDSI